MGLPEGYSDWYSTSVSPAVILPTVWRYLQTLDAAPYFLGLALSAFSLSGLLSGPLFGHWSDRTRTTKKIILFANLFEIIGRSYILNIDYKRHGQHDADCTKAKPIYLRYGPCHLALFASFGDGVCAGAITVSSSCPYTLPPNHEHGSAVNHNVLSPVYSNKYQIKTKMNA